MLSLFRRTKKLPEILSGFQRTLNELDALQVKNAAEIERERERMYEGLRVIKELSQEKAEAGRIYSNIQKLIAA